MFHGVTLQLLEGRWDFKKPRSERIPGRGQAGVKARTRPHGVGVGGVLGSKASHSQSADRLGKWSLETHPVLPTTPSCLFVAIIFGFLASHSSSSLEYGSQAPLSSHSHCCPVWPGWHSNVLEFLCKSATGLLPCVNSKGLQLLSFLGCTLSPTASQASPFWKPKSHGVTVWSQSPAFLLHHPWISTPQRPFPLAVGPPPFESPLCHLSPSLRDLCWPRSSHSHLTCLLILSPPQSLSHPGC